MRPRMSTSAAPRARHVSQHGEQRKRPARQAGRRAHHEHALDGAAVHMGQPGKGRPPAARHAHLRRLWQKLPQLEQMLLQVAKTSRMAGVCSALANCRPCFLQRRVYDARLRCPDKSQ